MITKLRKKLIAICAGTVLVVFAAMFGCICIFGGVQLDRTMDTLTDRIAAGDGSFPLRDNLPAIAAPGRIPNMITGETPFSTRYFSVWYDRDGAVMGQNMSAIHTVSAEQAHNYAHTAWEMGKERGWVDHFRYKVYTTPRGTAAVFVDATINRAMNFLMTAIVGAVMMGSALLIMVGVVLLSKRAVKPMAETYEKQRQFVTDANHELKTPLTLILTDLDILESEMGQNEWLDDIRDEGKRMSILVNQLTSLSRMDEDVPELTREEFSLSDMVEDVAMEFKPLAEQKGLAFFSAVQPEITYTGDEGALRRVATILLDNAVKYCDGGGDITLMLAGKKRPTITVENTCAAVDDMALDKLFDRFYREDKARTASNSFGIGLSLAQSIVHQHKGDIRAYKVGPSRIGFKVILK